MAIFIDEFYFHHKRVIPKWEKLGHPLDTLTVVICFLFTLCMPYNPLNLKTFCGLAIFSTLFITKDEFVHLDHCPKQEMWLHALLFVNHPVMLTCLGFLWALKNNVVPFKQLTLLLDKPLWITGFMQGQLVMITGFMLYQIIYWNFYAKTKACK